MLDDDAQREFDQLTYSLEQVREKLVDKWLDQPREEARKHLYQYHLDLLRREQDSINELEGQLASKKRQVTSEKEEMQHRQKRIVEMETELEQLRQKEAEFTKANADILQDVNELCKMIPSKREEVLLMQKTVSTKMEHYTKALKFFQERLGLHIKKAENDDLQFIFIYIDERDMNKEFGFSLRVDENNSYIVSHCNPQLDHISQFTEELNKSNNFSAFVLNVREEFKKVISNQQMEDFLKETESDKKVIVATVLEELTNKIQ